MSRAIICTHSIGNKINSQSDCVNINILEQSRTRVGLDHRFHNVSNGPLSPLWCCENQGHCIVASGWGESISTIHVLKLSPSGHPKNPLEEWQCPTLTLHFLWVRQAPRKEAFGITNQTIKPVSQIFKCYIVSYSHERIFLFSKLWQSVL